MQLKRVVFLLHKGAKHVRMQLGGTTRMTDENDYAADREQVDTPPVPEPFAPPASPPVAPPIDPRPPSRSRP